MLSNMALILGVTTSTLPRAHPKATPRSISFTEAPATRATRHSSRLVPARSPGTLMSHTRSSPLVQLFYIFLTGLKLVATLFSWTPLQLISASALCSRSDYMVSKQRTRALSRSMPQLPVPVLNDESRLLTLIPSFAHTLLRVKRLSMSTPNVSTILFMSILPDLNISNTNLQLLVRLSA